MAEGHGCAVHWPDSAHKARLRLAPASSTEVGHAQDRGMDTTISVSALCLSANKCPCVPTFMLQVSDDTLTSIFGTILEWHLQSYPNPVKELSKSLVAATLALYSTASSKLLPTPAKSHYLFNLRDFARVVQVRAAGGCKIYNWHVQGILTQAVAVLAACLCHAIPAFIQKSNPCFDGRGACQVQCKSLQSVWQSLCCAQGVMMLPVPKLPKDDPLTPSAPSAAAAAYKRLWVHEALRVFYDRLVDSTDRDWLLGQLRGIVSQQFGTTLDQLLGHLLEKQEREVGQDQLRK